jgi:hypothetical protein
LFSFEPEIQIQFVPSNFHKSFKSPSLPVKSNPFPPNKYKLLNESTHETALDRAPG